MPTAKPNRLRSLLLHPFVLCLLSFTLCFLLALVIFLPLDPFARQLEQLASTQRIQLSIEQPSISFPLGVSAERLSIGTTQIPHPPIQLENVELQPLWLSLIGTNQGIEFSMEAYKGQISGTAHRDGTLTAALTSLQLNQPLGPNLPLTLTGTLSQGTFDGVLPFAGKNQSQIQLELNDLALTGMKNLGSEGDVLPNGRITCSAEAKGPLVQILNLSTSSQAFELKGNGSLRLGRIPSSSSLNLNLVFTPKPGLDPALKDLLGLMKKPQPDGSYQLSVRGALTSLRMN